MRAGPARARLVWRQFWGGVKQRCGERLPVDGGRISRSRNNSEGGHRAPSSRGLPRALMGAGHRGGS